jgi:hypothetical protein
LLLFSPKSFVCPSHTKKSIKFKIHKIFGPKREEDVSWIKLNSNGLYGLYFSSIIVKVIKSRIMSLAGHVARMGEERDIYRVLGGRPEGRRPVGRPKRGWEDNTKMDFREIGIDVSNWL